MATVEQQRKPGDDGKGKAGWRNLNGAPAFVDDDGEIVAGCPGLEGYNVAELDETQDEREAKMDAAEDSGYEPERVQDARQEHAAVDAQSGADVTLVKDGDDVHAFGDDAAKLKQASQTGDGEKAEFKEEQLPHHVKELQREGHSVDVRDQDAPDEQQSHPEPEAEQPSGTQKQVPPAIAERVKAYIESIQEANAALEQGRQTDAKYGGEGRYESETHRKASVKAAEAQQTIDKFRELAKKNGIDGDAWLRDNGYEPYAGMSEAGQAWDLDQQRGDWWGVRTGNRENLAKAALSGEEIPDYVASEFPSGMTGHILKTMANHPDFQRTGEVRINNLHEGYADRLYKEMQSLQNQADDSGGEVFDLGDEVSPGTLGYHHPEHGTFMIVPPTFAGDKYEFRAVAPTAADDMPDLDIGDDFPERADVDAYHDPYTDEEPGQQETGYSVPDRQYPTLSRRDQANLDFAINEAIGQDSPLRDVFRHYVEQAYEEQAGEVQNRNHALRSLLGGGRLHGITAARIAKAQDYDQVPGFDEIHDAALRYHPELFKHSGLAGKDTEQQLFEGLKQGIRAVPKRDDPDVIGRALELMGDIPDEGSQAFGDFDYGGDYEGYDEFAQPPDSYESGFYSRAIAWLSRRPEMRERFPRLRDKCIRYARQKSLFGDDEDTRWITIGGHAEGGKKHAGGRRVEIKKSTGEIVKGPKELTGKTIGDLDQDVAGTEKDKRKQNTLFDVTPQHEPKPQVDPKAGKGRQRSLFDDPATFEPMERAAPEAGKGEGQALFEVDEPATTYEEKRRIQGLAEWIKRNPLRASEIRNKTSNPYEFAVAANMAHLDMAKDDWSAVPISGMTQSGPSFALPFHYKAAPTLFTGDAQNPCCGLCGHSIKHVFWLQNDAERQTLPVGSECVTHFMEGQSGQDIAKEFVATANRDLVRQAHDKVQGYINRYAPGAKHPRDAWTKMDDPEQRKNLWQLSKALGYDQWGSTMADFVAPDAMTIGDRRYDAATNRKVANWVKKHGDRIRDELAKADEYLGGDEAREEGLDQFEEEARDGEIGPQLDQMEPAADTADLTDAMQETTEIEAAEQPGDALSDEDDGKQSAQEWHENLKQRIAESNEPPNDLTAARKWIDDKLGISSGDKERWDFAQQYPGTLPEHVDKHFGGAFMPTQQETRKPKAAVGASTGTGKTGDLFDVGRNDSPGQELLFDTDGFDEPADKVTNWDLFGSQKQADEPQADSTVADEPQEQAATPPSDEVAEEAEQPEASDTPSPVTFDSEQHGGYKPLMGLSNRIAAGELSVDEFKQEYQRFRQSQPEFLADLNKRFNATQMRNIASNFGNYHARDNKKGENAKFIYDALMRNAFDIGPGMSSSWSMEELRDPDGKIKRLDAHVESIDEDTLQGHIAAQAEKVKKRQEAADAKQKALDNPETLDEYRQFVQQKSYLDLTPEQRKHFDELAAEESREARKKKEQETKGTVQQISENVGGFELSTNFHDKRGHNIFTATPKNRVERDEYNDMNRKAKQLGGWYYKPFRGTPGGFHFPDEESRAKFISLLEGDVDNSEGLTAKKEQRAQTVAEKLRDAADTLESRGNESLAADRRENTARQANMAASARAEAQKKVARAATMRNIADAFESGEAKYLEGVSAGTHLDTLDSLLRRARWDKVDHLRKTQYGGSIPYNEQMTLENEPTRDDDIDHVKYPYPVVDARKVREAIDAVKGRRGIKWDAATLRHAIGDEDGYVHIDTPAKWESFQAVMAKIKRSNPEGHKDLMDYLNRTSENFKRLNAMGITNEHELRQALREYLPIRGKANMEDPVRKAERELIGKKLEGFYPTPPSLIDEMLGEADIGPEHSVLEPSAGKGDIVDEIKNRNPNAKVKALEYNRTLQPVLEAKGHDVEYGDFLEHQGNYDRIVMNPPFEKRQDIDHVRHAYNLLNPGGRLVAIVSSGSVNPSGSEKKVQEFLNWIDENGGYTRANDAGAFAGSDAFRKTGVNTHMIVLDKLAQRNERNGNTGSRNRPIPNR